MRSSQKRELAGRCGGPARLQDRGGQRQKCLVEIEAVRTKTEKAMCLEKLSKVEAGVCYANVFQFSLETMETVERFHVWI